MVTYENDEVKKSGTFVMTTDYLSHIRDEYGHFWVFFDDKDVGERLDELHSRVEHYPLTGDYGVPIKIMFTRADGTPLKSPAKPPKFDIKGWYKEIASKEDLKELEHELKFGYGFLENIQIRARSITGKINDRTITRLYLESMSGVYRYSYEYEPKYLYWFGKKGLDGKLTDNIYVSVILDDFSDGKCVDGYEFDERMCEVLIDPDGEIPGLYSKGSDGRIIRSTRMWREEGKIFSRRFWLNGYDMVKAREIVNNYLAKKKKEN